MAALSSSLSGGSGEIHGCQPAKLTQPVLSMKDEFQQENFKDVMVDEAGPFSYGDRLGNLDVGNLDSFSPANEQHREPKGYDESSGGEILRDIAFHEYYGSCFILVAELKALLGLGGLKICLERRYKNIWAELDSEIVINHVSDPGTSTWKFQDGGG
ncbi:Uncharacterized protein Fot_15958 [Forsythia ovata]|uniref:RNase H type-1 domain-containing protein n=1 Tax=Forsythia ovata TaxID=205694 RepID=A0ABD1WEB9_9LAMI